MTRPGGTTVAVVVAAGSGERLGADLPKALVLLNGRSLLAHALERLAASAVIDATVVVHAPGHRDAFAEVCRDFDVAHLVPGGAERTDSVRAGVVAAGDDATRFAVHDAARCLVPALVIARTVHAVGGRVVAAAPGLPVPDTLKHVHHGRVTATVDRDGVWAVHTPQVVEAQTLRATLEWAGPGVATDDLGLVERAVEAGVVSGDVVLVEGDVRDVKITYPRDLLLARDLLAAEQQATPAGGRA